MGIRDILMLVLGYGCVLLAVYRPFYGLLGYCWLSFMKPQTLVWSSQVQQSQMVLAVAAALLLRVLITEGPKVRMRPPTLAFLAFWFWVAVTTYMSSHVDSSLIFLEKFSKIAVAVLLLTGLVTTVRQLKWLVALLAVCPGFYAAKLGIFLLRGASYTSHGGPLGLDNNDTALFMAMCVPMCIFAARQMDRKWIKGILISCAALAVPAVIVTRSRGGLVALAAAFGVTLFRRFSIPKAAIILAIGIPVAYSLVPQQTLDRYETIKTYEEDGSAMGRIRAWEVSNNMANDHPVFGIGLGMGTFLAEYENYRNDPDDNARVAHSVWFSTLAGAGYVGLGLYLLLIVATFLETRAVRRLAAPQSRAERDWRWDYAAMIECTIITFAVGATFLSQVGFEYVFAIYGLSVPLRVLATQRQEEPAKELATAPLDGRSPQPAL